MGVTHPCLQSNMRNVVKKILLVLLLLVGVGILLYPKISDYVNRIHSSSAMQSVSQKVHNTSREDLERQLALARGYNEALLQKKPFAAEYEDILNFEDGIMGIVRIPAIGVELPIYHGIGSDVGHYIFFHGEKNTVAHFNYPLSCLLRQKRI